MKKAKCKHEWDIKQDSKRCVICGSKDKNFGIRKRDKKYGYLQNQRSR